MNKKKKKSDNYTDVQRAAEPLNIFRASLWFKCLQRSSTPLSASMGNKLSYLTFLPDNSTTPPPSLNQRAKPLGLP